MGLKQTMDKASDFYQLTLESLKAITEKEKERIKEILSPIPVYGRIQDWATSGYAYCPIYIQTKYSPLNNQGIKNIIEETTQYLKEKGFKVNTENQQEGEVVVRISWDEDL